MHTSALHPDNGVISEYGVHNGVCVEFATVKNNQMIELDVFSAFSDTVTKEIIKNSFRKAAMKWHPDRHKSHGSIKPDELHQKFQKLQQAYEVLKDPRRKKLYDRGEMLSE